MKGIGTQAKTLGVQNKYLPTITGEESLTVNKTYTYYITENLKELYDTYDT